jgi:putative ABC transport system substrate-binding protein
VELHYAGGDDDRLRELAADVVASGPDLLVAPHGQAVLAARAATSTIPIVFAMLDPLGEGVVASLARPGGNATGVAIPATAARLELLHEAVPSLQRLAFLYLPADRGGLAQLRAFEATAERLGVRLLRVPIRGATELGGAIEDAARRRADGLAHATAPLFREHEEEIVGLAGIHRLATVFEAGDPVVAGGLISHGPDRRALARRMAAYVDRILRGARPGELPVEQPTRFEVFVNLRAARELGLTIAPAVLRRADVVIE